MHDNRNAENNKHSGVETEFKENMTYAKSIGDNAANHNYFILEKCEQNVNNHAKHYTEPQETNMGEDNNTIRDTDGPYAHVKETNFIYDYTTSSLTPGPDAVTLENVYNKLKIDRPKANDHEQKHGLVQSSEDDYDISSAAVTHVKDDFSVYNHIPRTAYKADATGDDITCDEGDEYDGMTLKVAKPYDSDYAHIYKNILK
ncbi:hypothetical protein DPMN_151069 [Dreissena polymorpha]|uniref:Uncharacterized protein n=2 Tax=Dreissena polymorpha TaxID=45954 RepID=A0A9D4FHN9_DREPO|nr:hypothetical protein DPMN_151069 [Dreissena polymorpha]